jgi:hypothetical protein
VYSNVEADIDVSGRKIPSCFLIFLTKIDKNIELQYRDSKKSLKMAN